MDLLHGKHPAIIKEEQVHAYPEGQTSYRSTREVETGKREARKKGAVSLMAVHFILLIILPITYIAYEQALNYQLRFHIRYEFLFRIPHEKFPGFQNPDYLTLGDTF